MESEAILLSSYVTCVLHTFYLKNKYNWPALTES